MVANSSKFELDEDGIPARLTAAIQRFSYMSVDEKWV
jgi:hypothetical protein